MKVTVFTPTYNRRHLLGRLYDSLCSQTNKDFEWVIVDDGSVDHTETLVAEMIEEGRIPIKYIIQENGGKHRAINRGVREAAGQLFFIVDSDDYLVPDAVGALIDLYLPIEHDDTFAGVSGVRIYSNGHRIGGELPFDQFDCTALEFGMKLGITGDLAEAFKLSVLKKYSFPEIPNERFCPEALVFFRMANDGYKMRFTNAKIYVCEYQEGGLTAHIAKVRYQSPETSLLYYSELSTYNVPLKYKIRAYINYWRFSLGSTRNFLSKMNQIGICSLLFYPFGLLAHFNDVRIWKKKI